MVENVDQVETFTFIILEIICMKTLTNILLEISLSYPKNLLKINGTIMSYILLQLTPNLLIFLKFC